MSKRIVDFFVVVLCTCIAAGSFYLFYQSLTQTLTSDLDPVGTVTIRFNSVQRRMGDRVLWDRIFNESPLYPGDIIRVAELSGAVLNFDGNQIELEDNTLIRVTVGSSGQPQIELSSGTLNFSSDEYSGNITLVVGGRTIEPEQGTILTARSSDEGIAVQVSEGTALIINEDGTNREAAAGIVFSEDIFGIERFVMQEIEPVLETIVPGQAEIISAMEPEPPAQVRLTEPVQVPPPVQPPAPVQPLAAPVNMRPVNGYRLGPDEVRLDSGLSFTWTAVSGANSYIVSIYFQSADGRRLITSSNPLTQNSWTLSDYSILDQGTFIWQVEAINRAPNGTIQRRGNIGENTFIVDIPTPQVQLHRDIGGLFGN